MVVHHVGWRERLLAGAAAAVRHALLAEGTGKSICSSVMHLQGPVVQGSKACDSFSSLLLQQLGSCKVVGGCGWESLSFHTENVPNTAAPRSACHHLSLQPGTNQHAHSSHSSPATEAPSKLVEIGVHCHRIA